MLFYSFRQMKEHVSHSRTVFSTFAIELSLGAGRSKHFFLSDIKLIEVWEGSVGLDFGKSYSLLGKFLTGRSVALFFSSNLCSFCPDVNLSIVLRKILKWLQNWIAKKKKYYIECPPVVKDFRVISLTFFKRKEYFFHNRETKTKDDEEMK